MGNNNQELLKSNKNNYPRPKQLFDMAEASHSTREFKKYEKMFFDAMVLFAHQKDEKGEESNSFYPTFAYGLMARCLEGKYSFSDEFDYKGFFDALLASDDRCKIGQAVYLFRFLSYGNTLSRDELKGQEKEAFEQRKKQFFEAFEPHAFLDKCDELGLVGPACSEDDYSFLAFSAGEIMRREK